MCGATRPSKAKIRGCLSLLRFLYYLLRNVNSKLFFPGPIIAKARPRGHDFTNSSHKASCFD
ncbi:hypothetical protein Gotur_007767, partial [Gossypium turneri]